MEEKKVSAIPSALYSGLLIGIVLILFSLVMYLLDIDRESPIMYFSYVIMAGGIFWAMQQFRDKSLGGFISYGQAFGSGFFTVLFASVLTAIFTYIYVTMIDPGMIDEILLKSEEAILERNPDISDEDLDMALSMTEKFTSPVMITIWGFVANVLFGTILSLIIAIFVKREGQALPAVEQDK